MSKETNQIIGSYKIITYFQVIMYNFSFFKLTQGFSMLRILWNDCEALDIQTTVNLGMKASALEMVKAWTS